MSISNSVRPATKIVPFLWYVDNAIHADEENQEDAAHTVSYLGVLHQALRNLAALG